MKISTVKKKLVEEKTKMTEDLYRTYTYRPLLKEVINLVIKRLPVTETLLKSSLS